MEFSLKTLSHFIEPFVALLMPFLIVGVDFDAIFKAKSLSIEESSRILMAVMFALFYFVKTIRKHELTAELESIKKRLDKLEKPNTIQPASA